MSTQTVPTLTWTTEPPTEAGEWWLDDGLETKPGVVTVYRLPLGMSGHSFWVSIGSRFEPVSDFVAQNPGVRWAGPIPEPAEPCA